MKKKNSLVNYSIIIINLFHVAWSHSLENKTNKNQLTIKNGLKEKKENQYIMYIINKTRKF